MDIQEVADIYLKKLRADVLFDKHGIGNSFTAAFNAFESHAQVITGYSTLSYNTVRRKQVMAAFHKTTVSNIKRWHFSSGIRKSDFDFWLECCCKHYYIDGVGGSGELKRLMEFFNYYLTTITK